MARFTTRVVLHDANWLHYGQLYPEMAKYGFTDEIVGDDGRVYKMPPGEYDVLTDFTAIEVRTWARAAADATGCKNAVFVTEAGLRAWVGLDPIRVQAAA